MSAKQAINDKLQVCVATYNKKGLQRLITVSVCNTQVIQLIWRDLHL